MLHILTTRISPQNISFTYMVAYAHTIEQTLKECSKKYGNSIFIETGTFKGKTTEIASKVFEHVYTIELSEGLYGDALEKFKHYPNVTCLQGDSGVVLSSLLADVKENAVFFLDAHWAGDLSARLERDCPVLEELSVISRRNMTHKDLIIIDDISFFDKKGEFLYTNQNSEYFPKGGLFQWDWTGIDMQKVLAFFPGKQVMIKDDRLFIGV